MYDRILLPTDGSEVATAAADAAISLADRFDAELHVIYALEVESLPAVTDDVTDELTQLGEETVTSVAERARDRGITVSTAVIDDGDPVHETIQTYSEDNDVDLVVMGTHGRSGIGRVMVGSVTEQTLRNSSVPVMAVHGDTVISHDFESILVPYDGSEHADVAVSRAIDLAVATGASIHVLNVVNYTVATGEANLGMVYDALEEAGERAVESVAERARSAGVDHVETAVEFGFPHSTVLEYVENRGIDCIVMGTHGRTGIGRVLLGSVTERVVRGATVPVITTTAEETAE